MRRAESHKIIIEVKKIYPKFSKETLCMVRNPEYGIQLTPEAEAAILKAGLELKKKYSAPPPRPKKPRPKNPDEKRVSLRLSQEDFQKLKAAVEKSGCKSTQEYLSQRLFL